MTETEMRRAVRDGINDTKDESGILGLGILVVAALLAFFPGVCFFLFFIVSAIVVCVVENFWVIVIISTIVYLTYLSGCHLKRNLTLFGADCLIIGIPVSIIIYAVLTA